MRRAAAAQEPEGGATIILTIGNFELLPNVRGSFRVPKQSGNVAPNARRRRAERSRQSTVAADSRRSRELRCSVLLHPLDVAPALATISRQR